MASAPRSAAFRSPLTHASALLLLSGLALLLTGCKGFFSCEGKSDCPCVAGTTTNTSSTPTETVTTTVTTTCTSATGTSTGTSTGTGTSTSTSTTTNSNSSDFVYVSNDAISENNVDGYAISGSTLNAISGSPFDFQYPPSAMVVDPGNSLLFAATDSELTEGFLYGYSITSGALGILDSGTPLVSESVTSLAISPDGSWLFALDTDGTTLEEYSINPSTGALTFIDTYPVSGTSTGIVTPTQVVVAPSGDFIVVTLGTGGANTFTFDTTTGIATPSTLISPVTDASGIFGAAVDENNNIYLAGTAGLEVFSATAVGVPTLLNTYTTGNGAHAVAINPDYTYVYVGNLTDGTISAFSIGTDAALTAINGSPFPGPPTVSALSVDSTSGYLVAAGYSATNGVELYTIGSGGVLTEAASEGTGTSPEVPVALALTQ